jgi:hypothetical protein
MEPLPAISIAPRHQAIRYALESSRNPLQYSGDTASMPQQSSDTSEWFSAKELDNDELKMFSAFK